MSRSERDRREYQKRYYQERLKEKRQRRPMGLSAHTETGQLELFKWTQQQNQQSTRVDDSTVVEKSTTSQQVNRPSTTPPAQSQLSLVDFNQVSTNQPSVNQLVSSQHSTMVDFSTVNHAINDVATFIHQMALDRLIPNVSKKLNWWAVGELVALLLLSTVIVIYTAKAVAIINSGLFPLVILLEIVTMFFSLTLAKWSGPSFALRAVMLLACVGIANFLVAKATLNQGKSSIDQKRDHLAQITLINQEIQRERALIADLESRSRFTMASSSVKRLDVLMAKLESLKRQSIYTPDQEMIILQVIIRVILGLSVILINHQVSHLIVNKKIFRLTI